MNPASVFVTQLRDRHRGVEDLKKIRAFLAPGVHAPIDHSALGPFSCYAPQDTNRGRARPRTITQTPFYGSSCLRRVGDPDDRKLCGFGWTNAVLGYNMLTLVIVSVACRFLKLPTAGNFDDFGIGAPLQLIQGAAANSVKRHTKNPKIGGWIGARLSGCSYSLFGLGRLFGFAPMDRTYELTGAIRAMPGREEA